MYRMRYISRFFGRGARAGRASNVSRHGELDGSLMSIQTWVWWRRNAFAEDRRALDLATVKLSKESPWSA